MNDFFEFVEQFLGAADAECGDQYGAVVLQRMLNDGFEALTAMLAIFV